ncbi:MULTISPECIES: helix-turn-helix transcriptional regulator [Citrobacter]|uniref:helix-turn-helix transcriptional regulator n=1 Tax=Citrobacter TaxID=544 RepID=UPI000CEC8E07|nr:MULTISPECIES: AlpA family phage regulatory protein [Citrobacter]AUZ67089.1 hypothetical protein C2U53_26470 [Citrobacter sp. CFNIH10]MBU5644623.1 AlpA family phage regulatory protein [Pluralibacter sp. S54_ASV_43]
MFLNAKQAAEHIGIGRTLFYKILGSDPTFPKPVQLASSRRLWDPARLNAWALARSEAVNPPNRGRAA